METFQLIVNGETKCNIQCEASQTDELKKVLSQLGIYSSFHGYNFQYCKEEANQQ